MIFHSKPTLDQEDYSRVLSVLESGNLVQGEQVARFEEMLASFIGVKGGVAVGSGTAGLHLSLLALGAGEGDEVIIPSYVCTALLNAVMYVRALPVIADIDRGTFNIDVDNLKGKITGRTKAIIVPHMFGLPADLDEILSLGIPVIEDCAQSIGAGYRGRYTGSFGVCSVFSFYTTKMLAAGEGGMVLSNDDRIIESIRNLRDYDEKESYSVRYNYKMTDIHAALGISQFEKLPLFIKRRKEIANYYSRCLREISCPYPQVPEGRDHVYYRYILLNDNPADFINKMRKEEIECKKPVFRPLHRYLSLLEFPVTDEIDAQAVSVPIYPSLDEEAVNRITHGLRVVLSKG